jgi:hypothetical protein
MTNKKHNLLEAIGYFDDVLSSFLSLPSYHTDQLLLAGRTIHLNTPSTILRDCFLYSLSHLIKIDNDSVNPELTIWYAEDKDLIFKVKAPPGKEFNVQGFTAEFNQDEVQIFFMPWQNQIFLYSRTKRIGIYWVKSAEDIPWWEPTFSFRILFHFWTHNLPAQLVHAGTMANNHSGVLITGPSGSGKSTSCLNLIRAGYQYLGDDYVWVELGVQPVVYALYQTAKIEPDNLQQRFSDWAPFIKNKMLYKQQKAIFNIKELLPEAWISSVSLKAILLPKVMHEEKSSFESTNPSHSLMAMAPTTLHHLPHNRKVSYQKLMRLSVALPAYYWHLGHNLEQFKDSFNHFTTHELS